MPLHVAAFKGHVAAATALLNGGAEVDAKTTDAVSSSSLTPLHLAAAQGHKPLVKLLLAQGADRRRRTTTAGRPSLKLFPRKAQKYWKYSSTTVLMFPRRTTMGIRPFILRQRAAGQTWPRFC